MPKTRSPTEKLLTFSPQLITVPETSRPRTPGKFIGANALASPERCFKSKGLMLVATTRTSTSSGPGEGSGKSLYSKTSGPPYWEITTAFIFISLVCFCSRLRVPGLGGLRHPLQPLNWKCSAKAILASLLLRLPAQRFECSAPGDDLVQNC